MTTPPRTSVSRAVDRIVPASRQLEGGGFEVFRPMPTQHLAELNPFLLLDEMAPHHHPPGTAIGAPPHPHRGFETVTYVLQGEVEHRDSAGNHGIIGPGDVQWMTAGDGIIHSEMPSERIQTQGGVGHGLQLWINLPASHRRTAPRYQALEHDMIPTAEGDGWTAHVVAGTFFGVDGPAETHTPVGLARLIAQPGTTLEVAVPVGHVAGIYAYDGNALVGRDPETLAAQHLALFAADGDSIELTAPAEGPAFEGFVLTGTPIDEPIARYGPFVMNPTAELEEAIADFNAGRMGSIAATGTI